MRMPRVGRPRGCHVGAPLTLAKSLVHAAQQWGVSSARVESDSNTLVQAIDGEEYDSVGCFC